MSKRDASKAPPEREPAEREEAGPKPPEPHGAGNAAIARAVRAGITPGLIGQAPSNRQVGRLLQTKLTVGDTADPLEREADRAADSAGPVGPLAAAGATPGVAAPPAVAGALAAAGQPLDPGTRTHMEARFGADFGGVRVHPESTAPAPPPGAGRGGRGGGGPRHVRRRQVAGGVRGRRARRTQGR